MFIVILESVAALRVATITKPGGMTWNDEEPKWVRGEGNIF